MMHILIAPDSFKESLSAQKVAEAIQEGFSQAIPHASFDLLPVGDGGEGTMTILSQALEMKEYTASVTGPLGQTITVKYARKANLALFESADVVGLAMIPKEKRNPLMIETRGIGELILHLGQEGVKKILIGVGGTASNDGGIGLAAGLGYEFYDEQGELLEPKGSELGKVARITRRKIPSFLEEVEIKILTDVINPLCGEDGATFVFAGQKGLSESFFPQVDRTMKHFYQLANPTIFSLKGAGAGGGIAAGLVTFVGGKMISGIDTCMDLLHFEERVQTADLVIVGEGKLDLQSLAGKAPIGIARKVPSGIPVIAICGSLSEDLPQFPFEKILAAFSVISRVESLEDTLSHAEDNLIQTARNIGNLFKYKNNH